MLAEIPFRFYVMKSMRYKMGIVFVNFSDRVVFMSVVYRVHYVSDFGLGLYRSSLSCVLKEVLGHPAPIRDSKLMDSGGMRFAV